MIKPIIIFVIAVFLFTLPVSGTVNFTQLQIDTDTCSYNTSDYVLDTFDCSNMAAQLHAHLEAKGYNHTRLVLGGGNGSAHAWIQCEGAWIEATAKQVMSKEWIKWIKNRYPNRIYLNSPLDCIGHKDKNNKYDCLMVSRKGLEKYEMEFGW